jgi:hypothetical protein
MGRIKRLVIRPSRAWMKYAITWVLLAILIMVGLGSFNWQTYRRMAARGVPGRATVVELLPKVHETVRYHYEVAGQKFEGQMQSWEPNPPLGQLSIGQSVVVYYDPQRPEESVLGDPKPMLRNEIISILLAAFVGPTFIVAWWAWRMSRKPAL